MVILSSYMYVRKFLYWHSMWTHANTLSLDLTKAIYSQSGTSFIMIALKGRISIYNEGSFCLPSLSMLILSLSAILTKNVPDWKWIAFVKSNAVVTPLHKAALYQPHIAMLGIWGDTWLTRGKYGIYVAVRGSYGVYVTPSGNSAT